MIRLLGSSLLAFALLAPSAACGDTADAPAAVGPTPSYVIGHAPVIVPNAAGRARLIAPEGESVVAFYPATLRKGTYALSVTGYEVASAFERDQMAEPVTIGEVAAVKPAIEPDDVFSPSAELAPAAESLAKTRTFQAPAGRNKSGFLSIDATLVAEGERVGLYAEDDNQMVRDVAQALVEYVDNVAVPESVRLFGPLPDIDGNGKLVLLMTKAVNGFSNDPGAFTGGFFSSKDLTGGAGTNKSDMLYLYLPMPVSEGGAYDHADDYKGLLSEVIVHELQHLISFGVRQKAGVRSEVSWLNEGLSHWAEAYFGFHRSNRIRARYFLHAPQDTPLVNSGTSLAERGAAYLFVKHLIDSHADDPDFVRKLVNSRRRGVENLQAVTGNKFTDLLQGWMAGMFSESSPDLAVDVLPKTLSWQKKVSHSAPVFLRIQGPAVFELEAQPEGSFRGIVLDGAGEKKAEVADNS